MPVPLSVTNPKGKGLAAQVAAELPTEGPFARLQAEQQPAAAAATPGDRAGADGVVAQQQAQAQQQQQQQQPAEEMAIETHSLSFSYPDIGAASRCAWLPCMSVHVPGWLAAKLMPSMLSLIHCLFLWPRTLASDLGAPACPPAHRRPAAARPAAGGARHDCGAAKGRHLPAHRAKRRRQDDTAQGGGAGACGTWACGTWACGT